MRIGAIFPQAELGGDVGAVREYGQTVEELGFHHLLAYDHVVGADPAVHQGWAGPYDVETTFHEPLVMFGYLAGLTTTLELVTGIIILPQRQTVLAAKQAAEVDLLSGGRFRFGVGLGWNPVEYEALDQPFDRRGRRLSEQIPLLRQLWTTPSVSFAGEFDTVTGAGLAPLPVQRPIPVWVGAASPRAYRRTGELADGWFPQVPPGDHLAAARAEVARGAEAAGRDPGAIGMEGRIGWDPADPDRAVRQAGRWRDAGASHLTIDTMHFGRRTVGDHLGALADAAQRLDL
jgi:probable F420-dependent oxidoreductase